MEAESNLHQPYIFPEQPFDPDKFRGFKTHTYRRGRMGERFSDQGEEVTVVDLHKFSLEESLWFLHKDRPYDEVDRQIVDLVLDAKELVNGGQVAFSEENSDDEQQYARYKLRYLLQEKHKELFDEIFAPSIVMDTHPFAVGLSVYHRAISPTDATSKQKDALTEMYYRRFGCSGTNTENNAIMQVIELITGERIKTLLSFERFIEEERKFFQFMWKIKPLRGGE